jgi:hypothetical protein
MAETISLGQELRQLRIQAWVAEFETELKDNLYKLWNRISSGSYFPPPIVTVKLPKVSWKLGISGTLSRWIESDVPSIC